MRQGGARPGWMTYFHVGDVDAAVAKASSLGATVHMPAATMDGVGRMAMIADPQGAPLYLMDPTPPPDNPDAQSDVFEAKAPGHAWWNELQTPDEPASTAFYTGLFGWGADQAMPMGDKGDYRFIEHDGVGLGAINPMIREGQPPLWLLYFGVVEIDAALEAAKAHGGALLWGPHQVPGGEHIFVTTDPAGAMVAFVGPKGA
jgi:predicted enzyme related to lactoylglutathione lyase